MRGDGFAQFKCCSRDVRGNASLINVGVVHMAHVLQRHFCTCEVRDFHVDSKASGIFFQGDTWLRDIMITEALAVFIFADELN